ncbi:hypothetical protein Pcinc_016943 [Petrolisthes cinctipes]|uniref:Uncharacterized protein n=1 Tax=Petrolisthes cinctipes TaxID=88211 RepID=A0AAE1FR28_PETCI|nr:hypothetical protein Pcinc_016943 [Petrolisthes cinctipes]
MGDVTLSKSGEGGRTWGHRTRNKSQGGNSVHCLCKKKYLVYWWRRRGWRRGVEWRVEQWSNKRCGEYRGGARDVELESGPRGVESGVVELRNLKGGPAATRGLERGVVELRSLESGPGATRGMASGVV